LVGKKSVNIFVRVLPYIEFGLRSFRDDSIVHIGEISNLDDLKAARAQKTAQDILENERPKIADMGEVVDGGAARIHSGLAGMEGHEDLVLSPKSILEDDVAHRSCGILGRNVFTYHDAVEKRAAELAAQWGSILADAKNGGNAPRALRLAPIRVHREMPRGALIFRTPLRAMLYTLRTVWYVPVRNRRSKRRTAGPLLYDPPKLSSRIPSSRGNRARIGQSALALAKRGGP